jgi:hypothetical protein
LNERAAVLAEQLALKASAADILAATGYGEEALIKASDIAVRGGGEDALLLYLAVARESEGLEAAVEHIAGLSEEIENALTELEICGREPVLSPEDVWETYAKQPPTKNDILGGRTSTHDVYGRLQGTVE